MSESKQRLIATRAYRNAIRQVTDETSWDGEEAARNDPPKNRSGSRIPPGFTSVDCAIVAALAKNARMSVREVASRVGLSRPSTAERIRRLEGCGAIMGYTISADPRAFDLAITAHVTLRAMPGEVERVAQMLVDADEVVEADRIKDNDCFVAKVVVKDVETLPTVVDRFAPYSSTETAIVLSFPVTRRLPGLMFPTNFHR